MEQSSDYKMRKDKAMSQRKILVSIATGHVRYTDISKDTKISERNVFLQLKELEKRGLVKTTIIGHDREKIDERERYPLTVSVHNTKPLDYSLSDKIKTLPTIFNFIYEQRFSDGRDFIKELMFTEWYEQTVASLVDSLKKIKYLQYLLPSEQDENIEMNDVYQLSEALRSEYSKVRSKEIIEDTLKYNSLSLNIEKSGLFFDTLIKLLFSFPKSASVFFGDKTITENLLTRIELEDSEGRPVDIKEYFMFLFTEMLEKANTDDLFLPMGYMYSYLLSVV